MGCVIYIGRAVIILELWGSVTASSDSKLSYFLFSKENNLTRKWVLTIRNPPYQQILVPDWLITSHVTWITSSYWLFTWSYRLLLTMFSPLASCLPQQVVIRRILLNWVRRREKWVATEGERRKTDSFLLTDRYLGLDLLLFLTPAWPHFVKKPCPISITIVTMVTIRIPPVVTLI